MKEQSAFEKRVQSIYEKYAGLSLQDKIDVIAQTFGCKTGEIRTSLCTGKWRGTSDMSIHFDNGESLFIGNHLTPKAKTVKVQTECVNEMLARYSPEIVQVTKETALPALLRREAMDNEIAAQKGLKPYKMLNVELNTVACKKNGCYLGWYYVTLAVNGKICTHVETGLYHAIAEGMVNNLPTRANYFTAGALKEPDVDYVFNNVGFSSASTLYTVPLREDVRERAEETLARRLEQERGPNPAARETGETVRTPRGTFHVTDMSREDMEAAGYGYHHQTEDRRYLIMGNGTRAFAISSGLSQEITQPEKVKILDFNLEGNHFIINADIKERINTGEDLKSQCPVFHNTEVFKEEDGMVSPFQITVVGVTGYRPTHDDALNDMVERISRNERGTLAVHYICPELQNFFDELKKYPAIKSERSVPYYIYFNEGIARLVYATNDFLYYADSNDMPVMFRTDDGTLISNNEFADIGLCDSEQHVEEGTEQLLPFTEYSLHFEDYSLPLFDTESELENAEDYLEELDDDYMLF